jgi:hypothetical protein
MKLLDLDGLLKATGIDCKKGAIKWALAYTSTNPVCYADRSGSPGRYTRDQAPALAEALLNRGFKRKTRRKKK